MHAHLKLPVLKLKDSNYGQASTPSNNKNKLPKPKNYDDFTQTLKPSTCLLLSTFTVAIPKVRQMVPLHAYLKIIAPNVKDSNGAQATKPQSPHLW